MSLKRVHRLPHECHAVSEEQHTPGPVRAHEQISKRDHRAGLARARRHNEQRLPLVILLVGLGNPADGARLIEALDGRAVDLFRAERLAKRPPLDGELELILRQESLDAARRVVSVIPEPVLIPVRVENHRALAELLLKAVRIELGLLLTDPGIASRPFSFHEAERFAVITPQHVIDEAFARVIGHAGNREFAVLRLVERPPRFLKQQIDEGVACCRFVVVVGVNDGRVGGLRSSDFNPKGRELGFKGRALRLTGETLLFGFRERPGAFLELAGSFLKLSQRRRGDGRRVG